MASTAAYCSSPEVKAYLPRSYSTTDLPDSTDTTFTSLATHIVEASREVDSALAEHFVTFNAWDHATVPCPRIIRNATTWLALSRCFAQLAVGDRETDYGQTAEMWEAKGRAMLDKIAGTDQDGVPRFYMIPNETVTTETLTFGAAGTYDVQSFEALLGVSVLLTSADIPYVIPDSVRVLTTGLTQYRYGQHFIVPFDAQQRKWKFVDLIGNLYTSALAKTITYDWSWRRYSEVQEAIENIPFVGGF